MAWGLWTSRIWLPPLRDGCNLESIKVLDPNPGEWLGTQHVISRENYVNASHQVGAKPSCNCAYLYVFFLICPNPSFHLTPCLPVCLTMALGPGSPLPGQVFIHSIQQACHRAHTTQTHIPRKPTHTLIRYRHYAYLHTTCLAGVRHLSPRSVCTWVLYDLTYTLP